MRELSIAQTLKLAVKKHNQGRLKEAETLYWRILEKNPNDPNALHLLGLIAHQAGRNKEAVEKISKAIQIKPEDAVYHYNLAMVYNVLEEEEKSAEYFKKVLEINPEYKNSHIIHYNLGIFFKDRGEFKKALEHYDKAIKLGENFFDARWNRALILLLLEEFKKGWEDYGSRFKKKVPTDSRDFGRPRWDGSSLKNKRLLIVSEQGFGDNIQFIRYLSLVKQKGAYVILECKKELRRLFESFSDVDELIEKKSDFSNIDFDYYVPLMDLPRIFNIDLSNIPNETPYLKADEKLVQKFKSKFNTNDFKIGIAWAGNPEQGNDKNRSTTFEKLKILKKIPGVKLFSLQKGKASGQLDDSDIVDLSEDINDFSDTAAIIENLDLVISVDTSVAHLAGAMKKPVWTLLCFVPDWRWFLNKNYSPWYPEMRLFRQTKPWDWDSVFNQVSRELKNYLN